MPAKVLWLTNLAKLNNKLFFASATLSKMNKKNSKTWETTLDKVIPKKIKKIYTATWRITGVLPYNKGSWLQIRFQ